MRKSSTEIELITKLDFDAWSALWKAYLEFYKTELPPDVFAETFRRYSDPNVENMRGWIAWRGGRAIGLVHVIIHPDGWQIDPITYLQDLYVDPNGRAGGTARDLVQTVYDDADQHGRSLVYGLTQEHNHRARALYDQVANKTDFIMHER